MITKKESRKDDYDEGYSHGYVDGYTKAGLDYAEERETMLDKIRAEIVELRSRQNVGVLECLDIIDKYKAESEVCRNDENRRK